MKTRAKITSFMMSVLMISACSNLGSNQASQGASLSSLAFSNDRADDVIMAKWARSCALCHVTGVAGAPVVGATEDWQARLAQGEESILKRVIEGYNSMPPLGYCMACEESDFRAMIGYMAGTNQ
jgi:cytochrome c5